MKCFKKITAGALALLLLGSITIPAHAEASSTEKEEVIYVMADAQGGVIDMEAVNIFSGGDITDYGDYSSVKILNTTDAIMQDGGRISISSDADKVYYQGTMKNAELPWDISIRYYLDGVERSAADIAGKSGALEIRFSVSKNDSCAGSFYEDYALQAAFTLDTERCADISADGATMANVGSDKQLSYTILPGKGIDTVISTEVSDFEMDAVSINAIKLDFDLEIDDAELMDKVAELMDATEQLNNGAGSLSDGTYTLREGSSAILEATASLSSGVDALDSGINMLGSGLAAMQTGIDTLYSKSDTLKTGSAQMKEALLELQGSLSGVSASAGELAKLTESSAAIKQGINGLYEGIEALQANLGYAQYKAAMNANGLDIDALKAGNAAAVTNLSNQIASLKNTLAQIQNVPGCEAQAYELQAQIDSLQNAAALLAGNNAAIGGTESYLNNISSGAAELYAGVSELKTKYEAFDAAISDLAGNLGDMLLKMSELTGAVDTLVNKYTELDAGINEYTDGVAAVVAGYKQLVGGVSSLADGGKSLLDGSSKLSYGAADVYDGIISLCDGASELADGTNKLYENTADMDSQVQDKIDEIMASIGGEETETVSFTSDKNTDVSSVQFVIKTAAIEKPAAEELDEPQAETLNFPEKLLKLFGL